VLVDHLIYAAPDLGEAVADIEKRLGVRALAGGRHIDLGTHNALLALGPSTYLEILAPDPGRAVPPAALPFGLDRVSHGGLTGWALSCDDIDRAVAEARRQGHDFGEVNDGQRVAPTGTMLRWRTAGHGEGLVPFLISWGDTEHPARSAPPGLILEAVHIEHPNPAPFAGLFTALGADIEVRPAATPALVAHLSGQNGSHVLR